MPAPDPVVNGYAILVLAALLLEWGVGLVADVLNLRALRSEPPPALREVYDAARFRRAQHYLRARTHLGLVAGTAGLLAVLGFWALDGFGALDRALRLLGLGPVGTGVLFIGALMLGRALVGLPSAYWATFVVEARFGFNRTSQSTFWGDRLKGALLGAALGGPLVAAVLALFVRLGPGAWPWVWAVCALVAVALQLVVPTWILPLFNRFTPLEAGALRDAILDYARRVRFPVEGLFVVDGSRRSTKANAFFTGFGRHKRIALFDTLVHRLEPDEVVAVVAHEVGHWKRRHVALGVVLAVLHLGLVLFLLSLALQQDGLFAAFGVAGRPVYAGLVFFALLVGPLELLLDLPLAALTRRHEYQADRFAIETSGFGPALATGLKKLAADGLENPTPHPVYVALHYSHPPLLARLAALDVATAASTTAPAAG